ncbi:hypothetical protein N431DRAFT_455105 [Stipitochalara longipes BDJ]|nr:hypothetical protein N431DRAFT_455105 [Stipitochalara longipes BDJ]
MTSLSLTQEEAEEPFFSFDNQNHNSTKAIRATDQEWESVKTEIEQLYIDQDKTLAATMQMIEENHGLKARQVPLVVSSMWPESLTGFFPSERKWKLKLREWGFEKYLSAAAMKILIAKAERRAVVEKKDTVFLHGKKEIAPERIELFKTRKAFREGPRLPQARVYLEVRTHGCQVSIH